MIVLKWELVLEQDIVQITKVSYSNFSAFSRIITGFIIMFYVLFLSAISGFFIYIPLLNKRFKYNSVLFIFFINFLFIPFGLNTIMDKVLDKEIENILIDSSYIDLNRSQIERCDNLIKK